MGTNYYAIQRADESLKNSIKQAVDDGDFDKAKEMMPKIIHIGKSSAGWQFLFNHNDWQYFGQKRGTVDSIEAFLKCVDIENEYHDKVTLDEFWRMVEAKQKFKADTEYGSIHHGLNYSNYTEFS